ISDKVNSLPQLNTSQPWDTSQRILPSRDAQFMPKLLVTTRTGADASTAVILAGVARAQIGGTFSPPQYIYFRGIEISQDPSSNGATGGFSYYLVRLQGPQVTGTGDTDIRSEAEQCNNIQFDQCYIHGLDQVEVIHGMLLE